MLIFTQNGEQAINHSTCQKIYVDVISTIDLESPSGRIDIGYKVEALVNEEKIILGKYSTIGVAKNVLRNIIESIQDGVECYRIPENLCPNCGCEIPVVKHLIHNCSETKKIYFPRIDDEFVHPDLEEYIKAGRKSTFA